MVAKSYTVEYHRSYYRKNREKVLARARAQREAVGVMPRRQPAIPDEVARVAGEWRSRADMRTRHPEFEEKIDNWALVLRSHLKKRARAIKNGRSYPVPVAISTQWIREQFERQKGRCFYTGIPFQISKTKRWPWKPSLDRVDPTKAYTPDNVVLCLCAVNYMKNDYSLEVFTALLDEIRATKSEQK